MREQLFMTMTNISAQPLNRRTPASSSDQANYDGNRTLVTSLENMFHFLLLCCCRPLLVRRTPHVYWPIRGPGWWHSRPVGRLRPQHVGGKTLPVVLAGGPRAQHYLIGCVVCKGTDRQLWHTGCICVQCGTLFLSNLLH